MSLESTGEIKLIMKFNLCLHNFSEFQVRIYIFVLIRKCKKDRYILNESYFGTRFLSIKNRNCSTSYRICLKFFFST